MKRKISAVPFFVFLVLFAAILTSACSSLPRERALPEMCESSAVISGLADIRYIIGNPQDMQRLAADVVDTWTREKAWLASQGKPTGKLPPSHILALSGGGDKGAFGAGFLNGWSAAGTRPEFLLVTGISTGALIAPFAFLGPEYDESLKALYTNSKKSDIVKTRGLLAILNSDGMADTVPLRNILRKHIDEAFLEEIAAEYAKGRELWISTTNIDSRKRVIWNMTKLAASRHPKAVDIFQDVMIASASIPVAFSPVLFFVEVDGKIYSEMHVDGGAMAQVFVYPPGIELEELSEKEGGVRQRILYVLMNARIDPEWAETERNVLSIADRAISSMIHTQGIGDIFRIYITTQRDKVDFNLAYIPRDFKHPHVDDFDTDFMRALFRIGYDLSAKGYAWHKEPPGFEEELGPLHWTQPASVAARLGFLPASYEGELPGAGNPILWHLDLLPDGRYQLRTTHVGRPEPNRFDDIGRWAFDQLARIVLRGGHEASAFLIPLEGGAVLQKLDMQGNPIESGLNDRLRRLPEPSPIEPRLVMTGMFMYMADAAIITLCFDGQRLPVAMEGDYKALEKAYLQANPQPWQPLLVSLEGLITQRPSMEESNPPQTTLVVERFLAVWPGESCDNMLADSPLRGTHWKLVRLDGESAAPLSAQRAAHLIFSADEWHVAGSGGCNRITASFGLDRDRLHFGAVASTRMSCPDGMDQEKRFIAALAQVTQMRIRGGRLELLDGTGVVIAVFEDAALH